VIKGRTLTAALMAVALTVPFGAFAMAANPASGTTTTGQTLSIQIGGPADGSRVNVPSGSVTATGTVSIGPLSDSGNVVYVVDVSGSTANPTGQDCNGDGVVNGADNVNGDGYTGSTLDCEVAGVMALNASLAGSPGAEAGLVIFGSSAAIADVGPAAGQQDFVSPLDGDANSNGQSDIDDVARSLRSTGQALAFTNKSVGTGTSFDAALTSIASAFASKAGEKNIAFMLSDGQASLNTAPGSPLATVVAAGIQVNTYSVGGASTGCGATANLRRIADATGGTCTEVSDPSDLSSVLVTPATISQVEVSLNGGAPMAATLTGNTFGIPLTLQGGIWNSIAATVTASDGTTATADVLVYGNRAPTADAGGPYTVNEGSSITLNGAAADPDGDAVSLTWAPSAHLSSANVANPSYQGVDDMVENLTLTADDPYGMSGSAATSVTVLNVAPSLGAITAPAAPSAVGTTVNAGASFTDPGILDTHTATFDWGDGGTSAGTVTEAGGNGDVAGSHIYTTPGVYTITLTVTDKDGGTDSAIYQYVVVYDPNGGFVTGGGWIDSPAGAYLPDPTLAGRASFGFNSKYKKGANVPDGQTQFQFKAGDLNFHSSSYDWLVVAGARAQYRGSGTINGAGDYRFMLTAIDGQQPGGGGVDKLRMKIWDNATGGLIYDNQMGDGDDADPTTALGGGSIVIHSR
jgi:hypothetical protein